MTGREDHPWVEVAVKVPQEIECSVSDALSRFVPLMMWDKEKSETGTCLLKTTVVMDGQVDGILADIDAALRQAEAKHVLSEPMSVELHRDWIIEQFIFHSNAP